MESCFSTKLVYICFKLPVWAIIIRVGMCGLQRITTDSLVGGGVLSPREIHTFVALLTFMYHLSHARSHYDFIMMRSTIKLQGLHRVD